MASKDHTEIDTGEDHGSGLEQTPSEPRQGTQRPADWAPPAGNPGSDQDALEERDNGTARPRSH